MTYRGYAGVLEVDDDTGRLFGRLAGLRDVVTFEGATIEDARRDFEEAVDFYLAMCAERGKTPDRPISDAVAVRLDPELYSQLQSAARIRATSLETVMVEALRSAMSDTP